MNKTKNITIKICAIIAALFYGTANAGKGMGMDSTDIIPGSMNSTIPKLNVATAGIKSSIESCSAYAGSYGISAGATLGKVILNYENDATNPNYGKIIYVNASGCSIPSQPITVTRQCSSFIGSYGIASGSTGTFTLTTEGNSYKSNYGVVISTDTSGCTVAPPPPPDCPASPGYQVWYGTDGSRCTSMLGGGGGWNGNISSGSSDSNSLGATGSGNIYLVCQKPSWVQITDSSMASRFNVPIASCMKF